MARLGRDYVKNKCLVNEINELIEAVEPAFHREHLYTARFGCITGIQTGPGAMGAAIIEGGN